MPDLDAAALQQRVARLEDELATCQAQAETNAINSEQAGRAMEERFTALVEEHGKLAAAKEQLQADNTRITEELNESKQGVHKLSAEVVKRDHALEEKAVQIGALQSDKRTLDKLLEHRQAELAEVDLRLRAAQEKAMQLTQQNTSLDAEVHEARAMQKRMELVKSQLEQERENLGRNSQWLEENLSQLSDSLKQERSKAQTQIMDLTHKLQEAEMKVDALQRTEAHLRQKLQDKEQAAEEAMRQLKAEREEFAAKEQQFDRELATIQKLAALYKENSEERAAKAREYEGVIRDLRQHLETVTSVHRDALKKAEDAAAAAEQRAEEATAERQRMLDAAASGQFPATPPPSRGAPVSDPPSPAMASALSATELYSKFADATEKLRVERLKSRQNDIILEQLCIEMEKKAVLVREQQAEYERVQAAYGQMSAALEVLTAEKRSVEAFCTDLESQLKKEARTRSGLEQQVRDSGQQVAVLLNEQQRRTSTHESRSPLTLAGPESINGSCITASDAISTHLLTFTSIKELQEKNAHQLAVIRDLSEQLETSNAQVRAEMEAEKASIILMNQADLAYLREQRQKQEELVQQIARQRDMFRKLLQESGSQPVRTAASAANQQLITAADAQSVGVQVAGEPDYKQLHADLEKELEHVRTEAAEHARLLREEALQAKEEASNARANAARATADAAFERQHADRQTEYLNEQRLQMQQLSEHSTKYQEAMLDLQKRLSAALADLQAVQAQANMLENRAHALEVDKALSAAAEKRLTEEINQLSAEKNKRVAELNAERAEAARLETAYNSERARLAQELAKAQQQEAEAQREVVDAQRRARDAMAAKCVIQEKADARVANLEEDVKKLRSAESEALQRAAAAQAKLDILQKALQKAEERVATLEFQANSRAGPSESAGGEGMSSEDRAAELSSQVKLLIAERASAQEQAIQAFVHVKNLERLAASSDEALKAMEEQHTAYKAQADKGIAAAAQEVTELKEQLEEARRDAKESRKKVDEALKNLRLIDEQTIADRRHLQEEFDQRAKEVGTWSERVQRLGKDVEFWRRKTTEAEAKYHREVNDHSDTINSLKTTAAAKDQLAKAAEDYKKANDVAEAAATIAETKLEAERRNLEAMVAAANRKRNEVLDQNKLLHNQLERLAKQAPAGGDDEMDEVRIYLRHEKEVLEGELEVAQQEVARLRIDLAAAKRAGDAIRAQHISEEDRAQRAQREEEYHAELSKRVTELNMVRESNTALRTEMFSLQDLVKQWRKRAEDAEKAHRPLQRTVNSLQAEVDSHIEEMKLVRAQAAFWEKRSSELQTKYGKVTIEEYQRVEAQLKELQQATKNQVDRAQLAQLELKLREAEDMVRARVTRQEYDRVRQLHQQADQALRSKTEQLKKTEADLQQARQSISAHVAQLEEVQRKMAEHAEIMDKQRKKIRSAATHIHGTYNTKKLPIPEWVAEQEQMKTRLAELEGLYTEINPEQKPTAQLKSELASKGERILQLEAQLEAAARVSPDVESMKIAQGLAQERIGQLQRDLDAASAKLVAQAARIQQLESANAALTQELLSVRRQLTIPLPASADAVALIPGETGGQAPVAASLAPPTVGISTDWHAPTRMEAEGLTEEMVVDIPVEPRQPPTFQQKDTPIPSQQGDTALDTSAEPLQTAPVANDLEELPLKPINNPVGPITAVSASLPTSAPAVEAVPAPAPTPASTALAIEPLRALEDQTSQLSASATVFQPTPMSAPSAGVGIMEEMRRKALEKISPSTVPIATPLQAEVTAPETYLQKTPAQLAGEAALKRTRTSDGGIDFPGVKRNRAAAEEDVQVAEDIQPAEAHATLEGAVQEAAPLAQEPVSPVPLLGRETATQEVAGGPDEADDGEDEDLDEDFLDQGVASDDGEDMPVIEVQAKPQDTSSMDPTLAPESQGEPPSFKSELEGQAQDVNDQGKEERSEGSKGALDPVNTEDTAAKKGGEKASPQKEETPAGRRGKAIQPITWKPQPKDGGAAPSPAVAPASGTRGVRGKQPATRQSQRKKKPGEGNPPADQ